MRIRIWLWALVIATVVPAAAAASATPYAFGLQIALSPKTAARLQSLHEGITVSASYYGDPKPDALKHADQIGQIDLGNQQIKLPGRAGPAHVSGTAVERARLAWVKGPVKVNVNVFSSRLSGPDNILACDFIDGDVAKVIAAEPVALHCGLISEDPKTGLKP